MSGLVVGADGLARCAWGASAPEYMTYHDTEWGRAVHGERALYERFTLEAFKSGLSWLTILRKREAFRAAFADFDAEVVAGFGAKDRRRLMNDAGIVRNNSKVDAAIANAKAVLRMRESGGLDELVWSHAPSKRRRAPKGFGEVPATTAESIALAKALKRAGFVFVGPTTAYAAMQACGLVNDHLAGCHARAAAGER
jgi:DNA-3-methyladenine glycosylase I